MIVENSNAHKNMIDWRHTIHQYPEIAFTEELTSDLIASQLKAFGIDVHRGLAKTGVVGTLKVGTSNRTIGLRADMDALPMEEKNDFSYRSVYPGKMHACGHDGHCAMLLGAAECLSRTKKFNGTVHFIFQPAEENEGGGRVMVEEGLFEKFPIEAVFGMHNWPGLPLGKMAMRPGPIMASSDYFEITIQGKGTHAAMPHLGVDPLVVAAHIVTGLQTITSRSVDPMEALVVSVTQIHGGSAWNVIPDEAIIRGTVRAFTSQNQDKAASRIAQIVESTAQAFEAEATSQYTRKYPPTVNTTNETQFAASIAEKVVGTQNVLHDLPPSMGAEDFSFMLQSKPGCYVWLGNGDGDGGCMLHNSKYDFNDRALPIGANYWVNLVESFLGRP